MAAPRDFQSLLFALQTYWAERGCAVLQGYDLEVGAGTSEHVKVLRDRLARDARARGQAGDGCRATGAQARDETQARLVPERREQRSGASETGLASGSASAPR